MSDSCINQNYNVQIWNGQRFRSQLSVISAVSNAKTCSRRLLISTSTRKSRVNRKLHFCSSSKKVNQIDQLLFRRKLIFRILLLLFSCIFKIFIAHSVNLKSAFCLGLRIFRIDLLWEKLLFTLKKQSFRMRMSKSVFRV